MKIIVINELRLIFLLSMHGNLITWSAQKYSYEWMIFIVFLCRVFQGNPDRLMRHLVEEHSAVDPSYVEDFLLTYRTFVKSPLELCNKLLNWFNDQKVKDRVSS